MPVPAFRFGRLATKFSALLCVALAAISAIAILTIAVVRHDNLIRRETETLWSQLAVYAEVLAEPLWDMERGIVRNATGAMAADPSVRCLSVRDIVADAVIAFGDGGCLVELALKPTLTRPIHFAGNHVGEITVMLNNGRIRDDLVGEMIREAALVGLLIVAAAAAAFHVLRATVLRPINRIVAAVASEDSRSTGPALVQWSSSDELGRIAGAINAMVQTLRARARVLADSEGRMRAILAASPYPLAVVRLKDQRVVHVNRRALDLFGLGEAEFRERNVLDFHVDARSRGAVAERLLAEGHVDDLETLMRRADGTTFWALVSARLLEYEGEPAVSFALNDITARKGAEAALIDAKEEAQFANRAKSEFLAHMSHELRTPLNAVIGFSDMMVAETFGSLGHARYAEYARDIRDSGQYLLALINDVLDLAKIEAGRLDPREEELDVAGIAASALDLVREQGARAGLALHHAFDEMPKFRGDGRLMRQILLNLLSNAIKFTEPGGRVTVTGKIGSHGGLKLAVADTGIGMAPEDLTRVLEPFRQALAPVSRHHQGTGLGLTLVKKLVEAHGGRLEILSERDAGTTVIARFPADRFTRAA